MAYIVIISKGFESRIDFCQCMYKVENEEFFIFKELFIRKKKDVILVYVQYG